MLFYACFVIFRQGNKIEYHFLLFLWLNFSSFYRFFQKIRDEGSTYITKNPQSRESLKFKPQCSEGTLYVVNYLTTKRICINPISGQTTQLHVTIVLNFKIKLENAYCSSQPIDSMHNHT